MIGLPDGVTACLFDLDGVLTSTAALHQEAWRTTFDAFLATRSDGDRSPFTPRDYADHVDGRPRADGVRTFLQARGIDLPEGSPDDAPDAETVNGVGNRKNVDLLRIIDERGVQPYPASVRYLEAARDAGFKIAVVTSSANGAHVLDIADLTKFVQARVDGIPPRTPSWRAPGGSG
jgi:beta-phosphoglucomutase-like phosphatase (HAD superfamily)